MNKKGKEKNSRKSVPEYHSRNLLAKMAQPAGTLHYGVWSTHRPQAASNTLRSAEVLGGPLLCTDSHLHVPGIFTLYGVYETISSPAAGRIKAK